MTATVFILAGNPDKFPVEYYNSDTRCYEGILPELLKQIGEKTGLRFTYIRLEKMMNGRGLQETVRLNSYPAMEQTEILSMR